MDRPRTVGELRPRPALALDPELTVLAAAKKMQAANSDCGLIVSAAGELQGILTDTDVATKVLAPGLSPETTPIAQIMTASPQCVREAENAVDALCTMVERRFRHLPVLDAHGAVVGVLDVAKCLYDAISRLERHLSTASSALSTAVLASMPFGHAGGGSAQQLVDGMVAKLFAPSLADLLNSGTAAAQRAQAPTTSVVVTDTAQSAAAVMATRKAALLVSSESEPCAGIVTPKVCAFLPHTAAQQQGTAPHHTAPALSHTHPPFHHPGPPLQARREGARCRDHAALGDHDQIAGYDAVLVDGASGVASAPVRRLSQCAGCERVGPSSR